MSRATFFDIYHRLKREHPGATEEEYYRGAIEQLDGLCHHPPQFRRALRHKPEDYKKLYEGEDLLVDLFRDPAAPGGISDQIRNALWWCPICHFHTKDGDIEPVDINKQKTARLAALLNAACSEAEIDD